MRIRNSFVGNSSSTSYISGLCMFGTFSPIHLDKIIIVDKNFASTLEFGWGPEDVWDFPSKLVFAYLQCLYSGDRKEKRLKMIHDVLKDCCGVEEVKWNISTHYGADGDTYAYIDHASNAAEGENEEIFDNKMMLSSFLFNENVILHVRGNG